MQGSYKLPIKIKLTSAFLGDIRTPKGKKLNIKQVGDELHWVLKDSQWRWAMKEAIDSMGLQLVTSTDFVRLPTSIRAPKVYQYQRVFHESASRKQELMECFREGTVMSFDIFVLGSLEEQSNGKGNITIPLRPPTKEEVMGLFSLIGSHIGLSPWGSKFGYGRFSIVTE